MNTTNQDLFHLLVDYTVLTPDQVILENGYRPKDWECLDKVKTGVEEFELKLFSFGHRVSSEEAIRFMKEDGFDPADGITAEAFKRAYPQETQKGSIVFLNSSWRNRAAGGRGLGYLRWHVKRCYLCLIWYECGWDDYWRFAGVRKVSKAS